MMTRIGLAILVALAALATGSSTSPPSELRRRLQQQDEATPPATENPADPGAPKLVFGQSCALTGPASALGIGMRNGILAAFKEANDAGGVKGFNLELITYDDKYEPEPAAANTRKLIEEDKVYALIGEVGTPTSKVAVPIAEASDIPFLAPFTGAMFLRRPWKKDVVNVRGSYNDETAAMVEYFVKKQKKARISIFYQNDSFGGAGLAGVLEAMEGLSLSLYTEGTYERNTENITSGFLDVYRFPVPPEAVVMIGTYTQLAMFVNMTKDKYPEADIEFSTVSFVGADAFSAALGSAAAREGVIVSQVVPLPTDTSLSLTQDFQDALSALDPDLNPGFVEYEGYMAGRLAVVALGDLSEDLLREGNGQDLLDTIYYDGIVDIGDYRLGPYGGNCSQVSTGCQCNQGMREVWLTEMDPQGKYEVIFQFPFGTCGYEAPKSEVLSFGQSCALSGPNAAVGIGIGNGIRAAFQEVNLAGGVNGFQLKLISLEDEDQPEVAVNNSVQLIKDDSVFALVGFVGANTSIAVSSMADDLRVPFIAPFTGAQAVRKPFVRNTLNIRSSYSDELFALFANFAGEQKLKTLALAMCPGKGEEYLRTIQEGVSVLLSNYDLVLHSSFIAGEGFVSETNPPEGVVFACSESEDSLDGLLIKLLNLPIKQLGLMSNLLRDPAVERLVIQTPERFLVASPVPALADSSVSNSYLVESYRAALMGYDVNLVPDPFTWEGYLAGKFTVAVLLGQQPGQLLGPGVSISESRESFLRTVYDQQTWVLDGTLQLGPFLDKGQSSMLESQGCNEGARNVYYKRAASGNNSSLAVDTLKEVEMEAPYSPYSWTTCGVKPQMILEAEVQKQDPKKLAGVIVGVIVGVLLLLCVLGIFVWRHIKRTRTHALESTWKVPYDELQFDRLLGTGASGSTFRGYFRGAEVVIKQMDRNQAVGNGSSDPQSRNSVEKRKGSLTSHSRRSGKSTSAGLQHEIQMLYKLRHPNIRLFMGAHIGKKQKAGWKEATMSLRSTSNMSSRASTLRSADSSVMDSASIKFFEEEHPRDSIYIVSEYMSRGTLYDVITNPTLTLTPQMQTEFLRDIAKGMSFLHAQQPPVIHADIKSKNMLLDDRWTVKVGDFGHSLILGAIGDGNRIGTPYFCAPEVLGGEQNSTASDVYSFGILMWETFARKDVFLEQEEEEVLEGVKAGTLRPPVPSIMPGTMQSLMIRCWDQTPANRPTFDEVTREIQDWLDANPARNVQAHANIHHQRTSQLVNKMLPEHVARALQEGRPVEPEHFDDCTILFSDIVGYTTISSAFAPKEVMSMLDRLYSAFDALTRRHQLFKVETIGDAYMVVGNVPLKQSDHAARVCKMALDMIEVAGTIPVSLSDASFGCISIRIGINSGPVVASVVGDLNPRYTLFGDTVNVASRMESTSQANSIQLSSSTKRRVEIQDPTLQLQFRGEANIKGKGAMNTYWLRPPGHMLLLNWMSGLINKHNVTVEDLKQLPRVFIEQAESEIELDRVLKMRGYPILKILADVLESDSTVSLQDVLALSPAFLSATETSEHLRLLVKWRQDHKDKAFLLIVEEVLRDREEDKNGAVELHLIVQIPMVFLVEVQNREQFTSLLEVVNSPDQEAFLGFAAEMLEERDPEGITLDVILQLSAILGPPCTKKSQANLMAQLIIDDWMGLPFLEAIVENSQGNLSQMALARRESPSSIIENEEALESMSSMNTVESECSREIIAIFATIPANVWSIVENEEQLLKLIDLGIQPMIGGPKEGRTRLRSAHNEAVVFNVISRSIKERAYTLMEILDHPSTILREIREISELEAIIEWPLVEQKDWIASLIREGEYDLQAFTGAPSELLAACVNKEDLSNLMDLMASINMQESQSAIDLDKERKTEAAEYIKWITELVVDQSGTVAQITAVPRPLWTHVQSKTTLARLLELKGAACLPWIVELVTELEDEDILDRAMCIPTRLLYAFKSKGDLEWALTLSDYSNAKHSDLMTSAMAQGADPIKRSATNNFIHESHRGTLTVLQNAALQKMMYKKGQLEEELKSLESKINDEWGGK